MFIKNKGVIQGCILLLTFLGEWLGGLSLCLRYQKSSPMSGGPWAKPLTLPHTLSDPALGPPSNVERDGAGEKTTSETVQMASKGFVI